MPVLAVIGTTEILIVLAILLLFFGATRLPQLARALGMSARELKRGMREVEEEDERPTRSASVVVEEPQSLPPQTNSDASRPQSKTRSRTTD